ncbi:dUTP diphosphatase [Desulfovibrio sp. OttesenSCG-928-A18]|nr:dUTP diphosphatase [Desulfovibrio sp. OttesenSCG-928-A18]
MTSVSPQQTAIKVRFFRDAPAIYGMDAENAVLAPATEASAGLDLRACLEKGEQISIAPGHRQRIPTGIAVDPGRNDCAGFIYSRSGLGAVHGLTVAQGVGVIDPDYRGEIQVFLLNTGLETQELRKGDRIAQLVFQPIIRPRFILVSALDNSARGEGGFGHTGRR